MTERAQQIATSEIAVRCAKHQQRENICISMETRTSNKGGRNLQMNETQAHSLTQAWTIEETQATTALKVLKNIMEECGGP